MSNARLATTLAALALVLAACSSGNGDTAGGDGASTVAVTGTDALAFDPGSLTTSAGTVTVELTAEGAVEHTFVVEEFDDTEVVATAAGQTASGSVELDAATYTFYCSVPGHRDAGMEGQLTVQ